MDSRGLRAEVASGSSGERNCFQAIGSPSSARRPSVVSVSFAFAVCATAAVASNSMSPSLQSAEWPLAAETVSTFACHLSDLSCVFLVVDEYIWLCGTGRRRACRSWPTRSRTP